MDNLENEDIKSYIDSKIGLIRVFNNESIHKIQKEDVFIGGNVLKAGSKTTLNNFFNEEVIYLGMFDGWMQFQIGEDDNLFEHQIYTNEFKKITEQRMLSIYQIGTARDYLFKNGEWK